MKRLDEGFGESLLKQLAECRGFLRTFSSSTTWGDSRWWIPASACLQRTRTVLHCGGVIQSTPCMRDTTGLWTTWAQRQTGWRPKGQSLARSVHEGLRSSRARNRGWIVRDRDGWWRSHPRQLWGAASIVAAATGAAAATMVEFGGREVSTAREAEEGVDEHQSSRLCE